MAIKTFVSKNETTYDADTYIGQYGEMWINSTGTDVRVGDNTTPGGVEIGSGGNTGDILFVGTNITTAVAPANITIITNNSSGHRTVFNEDGTITLDDGTILGDVSDSDGFDIFANNNVSEWNSLTYGPNYDSASSIYLTNNNGGHRGSIEIRNLTDPSSSYRWNFENTGSSTFPGNVNVSGQVIDVGGIARRGVQSVGVTAVGPGSGSSGSGFANISVSNVAPILYTGLVVYVANDLVGIYRAGTATAGAQSLQFTSAYNNASFTAVGFVTTPVGTSYSTPVVGTTKA